MIARIEALGGYQTRQRGSHRRFEAKYNDADGVTRAVHTTVQVHKGKDIPTGTLRSIQKDMEPAFGKGWLQ
ncbi:type II toxin-antitoxin system HicA family toxin [Branchiibius cervicis]|uniref:Type II toxin-antitoxin system HicA family toxin n=1 Tax=Branchiibius cervicis TaxID=908252 RepID=A0ABW2AT45_9MICO